VKQCLTHLKNEYVMKYLNRTVIFFIVFLVYLPLLSASDLLREKRMAEEIVDAIVDGDAVVLTADNHEFLTIYTEADEARGIVIILHGRGFHPDWQDAINPLRVGLVDAGWSTLSVQMPVLEKQAKYYDYVPLFPEAKVRIEAAISYARKQIITDENNNKIVLIAHSCGAHMAMSWFEEASSESVDAYVGIGMGATDYRQPMKAAFPLENIKVPVLDVYAENDYPAVIKRAVERLRLISQAGNKKSGQTVIEGADHYYVDKGEELTQVISQWLDEL